MLLLDLDEGGGPSRLASLGVSHAGLWGRGTHLLSSWKSVVDDGAALGLDCCVLALLQTGVCRGPRDLTSLCNGDV